MITSRDGGILGSKGNSTHIKKMSMRVMNLLQDYKRGDIVITLAVLWLGVCERFNVNPGDALGVASRMRTETFDNKHQAQFKALKEYMDAEL